MHSLNTLIRPAASASEVTSYNRTRSGHCATYNSQDKFGNRAFSVSAPRAWNRLPIELRTRYTPLFKSNDNWKLIFTYCWAPELNRKLNWLCNAPSVGYRRRWSLELLHVLYNVLWRKSNIQSGSVAEQAEKSCLYNLREGW